jgi:hypothetical protein
MLPVNRVGLPTRSLSDKSAIRSELETSAPETGRDDWPDGKEKQSGVEDGKAEEK